MTTKASPETIRRALLAGIAALALATPAAAQPNVALPAEPPSLTTRPFGALEIALPEKGMLEGTPGVRPAGGQEVLAKLDVVMLRSQIWNPNSNMFDQVELRAYQDSLHPAKPGRPYVAPTLTATPGDTVRVLIRNLLPPEQGCPGHGDDINEPHCFNTTNLHSHGLWVSPAGISDNVLRTLPPNKDFTYEYEYNIPADHPAGTFWYHPHVHGSTAIQVSSGLAGALIVKGDRLPAHISTSEVSKQLVPGDIDLLLRLDGADIPDNTFVFQQIQYICRDPNSKSNPNTKVNKDGTWRCDKGDVGVLDAYDVFGGKWRRSGRFTTVNGATMAVLEQKAKVGVPERWRFIHGGVADTINISIRKRKAGAKALDFSKIGALSQDEIIQKQCEPAAEAVPQFEIAADGLTRSQVLERNNTVMQPGYRSDVLVAFNDPGSYCVIDETVNVTQSGVEGSSDRRQLLFLVDVEGQARTTPPREQIARMMVDAAGDLPLDATFRTEIQQGLRGGLATWAFAPHATLGQAKIDNQQNLIFSLTEAVGRTASGKPTKGAGIGHTPTTLRQFDPKDFQRTLVLGDTDEWTLSVNATDNPRIGHPFHIHVNPFEIRSVMKDGVEQTDLPTSQYFGMRGVFKDTVFVEPGAVVTARSHYRRYVGDFVLHCHILNHEDEGMMEMVRIADRGADGKALPFGHGLTDPGEGTPKPAHHGH